MSHFYAEKIQYLSPKPGGRVFITGDIHGAYDLVISAMRKVKFDPKKDILLVVGDLIDRGQNSHRVLAFLRKSYVHAVRGNHEDMLIDLYAEGVPDETIVKYFASINGFDWWLKVDQETRMAIVEEVRKLPLVIEIDTPRGPFGVVHADVANGLSWQEFKAKVQARDENIIHNALWGRDRLKFSDDTPVEGIGRIFVGHNVQWKGLKVLGNIYAIDTGSIFAETDYGKGHMTFTNALACTQLMMQSPRVEDKMDIRDGNTPDRPFKGDIKGKARPGLNEGNSIP